jgi:hypothetical protein
MLGKQPQLVHTDFKEEFKQFGELTERIKPKKEPKVKVAKEPNAPKEPKGEGRGGWGVHPKHYGQGKILRSFFDGAWWTAKHDDIVDDVNASLAAGGKQTLIENPRPFSASSGLRGGDKYWTKE